MSVKIGINEDVILSKVEIVDKEGKVSIDFTFGAEAATDLDPLNEKYDENGMLITSDGSRTVKLWPINVPKEVDGAGVTKTIAQRIDEAYKSTQEYQNLFTQFARCFVTGDKIKFERFRGIEGFGKETMSMLLDEKVLLTVTTNLAQQFVVICGEYFGNPEFALRILFKRQSATKAFPAFRDKFLQQNTFVEQASIPKTASAIKFLDYEIRNNLNSDKPAEGTTDPIAAPPPQDEASLFGNVGTTENLDNIPELNS